MRLQGLVLLPVIALAACASQPAAPDSGTPVGGTSGTTGAATTGIRDLAGCSPGLAPDLYQSCSRNQDCACPLTCHADPLWGRAICEETCATGADCRDPSFRCVSGICQYNLCGGDTGNGAPFSVCDATDAGDGTCVSQGDGTNQCIQGGSASDGGCSDGASRAVLQARCPAGALCFSSGEATECHPQCDPLGQLGRACPAGTACGLDGTNATLGGCFAQGPAGCLAGLTAPAVNSPCSPGSGCGCGSSCALDAARGANVYGTSTYCEAAPAPCGTTRDCDDPRQHCRGGLCESDGCGDPTLACDASDAGDGTCVPQPNGGPFCTQAGPNTGYCTPSSTRDAGLDLCASGDTCISVAADAGYCYELCLVAAPACGGGSCHAYGSLGLCY